MKNENQKSTALRVIEAIELGHSVYADNVRIFGVIILDAVAYGVSKLEDTGFRQCEIRMFALEEYTISIKETGKPQSSTLKRRTGRRNWCPI